MFPLHRTGQVSRLSRNCRGSGPSLYVPYMRRSWGLFAAVGMLAYFASIVDFPYGTVTDGFRLLAALALCPARHGDYRGVTPNLSRADSSQPWSPARSWTRRKVANAVERGRLWCKECCGRRMRSLVWKPAASRRNRIAHTELGTWLALAAFRLHLEWCLAGAVWHSRHGGMLTSAGMCADVNMEQRWWDEITYCSRGECKSLAWKSARKNSRSRASSKAKA